MVPKLVSKSTPQLWLCSASPRRSVLLQQLGLRFETLVVPVDETRLPHETPHRYTGRIARRKAEAGFEALVRKSHASGPITLVAADTTVVLDGTILGKPSSAEEALEQLSSLSGRDHVVLTAVVVVCSRSPGEITRCESRISRSRVWFKTLSEVEAGAYWATGEPTDKAGGYGIQGLAAQFVTHLEGSYSAVMGLPIYETAELLRRAGVPTL